MLSARDALGWDATTGERVADAFGRLGSSRVEVDDSLRLIVAAGTTFDQVVLIRVCAGTAELTGVSPQPPGTEKGKSLATDKIGVVSGTVLRISTVATGYTLTASIGLIVAAVGLKMPVILIAEFIPMFLTACAYRELNSGTPTVARRSRGPPRPSARTSDGCAGGAWSSRRSSSSPTSPRSVSSSSI